MEAISLKNPYPNGVDTEKEHLLEPFISVIKEIREKITAGERVYIRITAGELKGSIAYIKKFNDDYQYELKGSIAYIKKFNDDYQYNEPRLSRSRTFGEPKTRISNASLNVILAWDKRRNLIKWSTYDHCEYLRDYDGPTVWEKFDKKAAEKKLLEENRILDRDNNILNVGDRVIYINARYGSGASLDRGRIEKIKFNVQKTAYNDSEYKTIHVIIRNDNGSKSDIKNPHLSIIKIDGNDLKVV